MISILRALVPAAVLFAFPGVSFAADKVTEIKSAYPPCTNRPTAESEDQARGHHKLATLAFEGKRWKDAADLWTKAYALDCSRPRVFWNLGQAFEEAGDLHAAVAMYELLAERAPSEVPDDLPPKIHQLRVAAQKLDDEAAAKSAADKPAPEQPREPKPVEMERPLGVVPWILVGSGAAVAVGGAVLLGVGQAQASSAEDGCTDPETRTGCSQEAIDDGESGELMSQIGQGLLYGGGGVLVLGLVLQFAANGEEPVEKAATDLVRDVRFAVVPVDDGAALFVGGRF